MDQNGDGLVSPEEKQYAFDHFAPGKERDHAVAVQRVKTAEIALTTAKQEAADKTSAVQAWNTAGNVGMIGTAAASLGIFVATYVPFLAAIPAVNIIAIVLAGLFGLLALIAKIGQVVSESKKDKADQALEAARVAHDRAFQELGATLERPIPNEAPVAPANPAPRAPIATRTSGVSLRRVA